MAGEISLDERIEKIVPEEERGPTGKPGREGWSSLNEISGTEEGERRVGRCSGCGEREDEPSWKKNWNFSLRTGKR